MPDRERGGQEGSARERESAVRELERHGEKLRDYEKSSETLGERNSYSKTDPDATFMHMKGDAMRNGQTKPGYNLQIGTNNQFITDFSMYPNPADTLTMPSFLESYRQRYGRVPEEVVADSGYGSEENYRYMEESRNAGYRKKARELLTSWRGIEHRSRRCVEPEAVFGQMKYDMGYDRFRHVGKDKVSMDFTFFAIAFNLRKLCAMARNKGGDLMKAIFSPLTVLRTVVLRHFFAFKLIFHEIMTC